ncbi:LisH domain-containing protein armc9 [Gonapodya sp. JEL0774]|nr:LisH domain-containing protein armc9 [Gonapodya sp. JEL0774]
MTRVPGTTDFDADELVREYLEYASFPDTVDAYETESAAKGRPLKDRGAADEEARRTLRDALRSHFLTGDADAFFSLWDSRLHHVARESAEGAKVEFLVRVYFAVYPVHPGVARQGEKPLSLPTSLSHFKRYIETRGSSLARDPELLPYFALPYVADPGRHPSFGEVMMTSWVDDLWNRANAFLKPASTVHGVPKLVHMIKAAKEHLSCHPRLEALQIRFRDLQEAETTNSQRLRALQTDLHSAISIAHELARALAASLSGDVVSLQEFEDISHRLVSLARGATPETKTNRNMASQEARTVVGPALPVQMIQYLPPRPATKPRFASRYDLRLDYAKLRRDLKVQPATPETTRSVALIIDAMRVRLVRSRPMAHRIQIVETFVTTDILCIKENAGKDVLAPTLTATDPRLPNLTSALLNALSSVPEGRAYLLHPPRPLLALLFDLLKSQSEDNILRRNLLATLQKLSLRRAGQSALNTLGMVTWLVQSLLSDPDSLSEYTIEYACSLLMNLVLRSRGRREASGIADACLRVLSELGENPSIQVRTYVNGTLFGLLSDAHARECARAAGFDGVLGYWAAREGGGIARQVEFVRQKLTMEDPEGVGPDKSDVESNDGEEDDGEYTEVRIDHAYCSFLQN